MIKKVVAVVFALGIGSVGILGGLFAAGVIGVPDAGLEDNAWGEVDDERIEVITTVWIDNPNPGINVDELAVEYALEMNDVSLADGDAADVTVPSGNSTTELRTGLRYQQIPVWWASHVDNGEVSDLEADVTVHAEVGPLSGSPTHTHEDEIETDLEPMVAESISEMEGEHSLSPVDSGATGDGTLEPTVEITDTDAEWGAVDRDRTELHLTFDVHNPNAYPLPTPAFTGEMEFNDHLVAEWDAHEVDALEGGDGTNIPPGESREVTFVVDLDNDDVAAWFATHVDNEEVTDAEMRAQLAMQIGDETVTIPPEGEAVHCEYDVATAIFVDQESGLESEGCEFMPWATPDERSLDGLEATGSGGDDDTGLIGGTDADDRTVADIDLRSVTE
ncbi:LEA type 2 family protein [Natrarchaeobius chitinivorans]|uniref:Water stress and hypersensitive response domain-containing protein n=1 Tax=Natrarchaeobius chitinivorans TaxID=1679083 RepID=A0A3N6LWM0_NATCH|nr:LEA type 2 family protein [Natrarchaeobius chitinivorans]RQG95073.1 Water stress and hypersensitive response domain-containing protein [Natrarchaeobius chitinivorans]